MVKPLTNPFVGRPTPLGSLLTAAGQRLSAELDQALIAAGFPDLRAAHAPIFMAIEPAGSRSTEIARSAKMTKQSAGELVRYLADRGYVVMAADPVDGRAKSVQLTDRGWEAIAVGEQVITAFDRWLADLIGDERVSELRGVLTTIAETDPTVR